MFEGDASYRKFYGDRWERFNHPESPVPTPDSSVYSPSQSPYVPDGPVSNPSSYAPTPESPVYTPSQSPYAPTPESPVYTPSQSPYAPTPEPSTPEEVPSIPKRRASDSPEGAPDPKQAKHG